MLAISKWTLPLAYANLAFNALSFGLFCLLIRYTGFCNEVFFDYWVETSLVPAKTNIGSYWGRIISGLIIVAAFALSLDSLVNMVKACRNR